MTYGFQSPADEQFPSMVVAEIGNVCNLRCRHCGYRRAIEAPAYRPTFLDYDLFRKVVDEVTAHPNSFLRFTSDGEPLLHPRLVDMVRYAKQQGVFPVTINTNGMLLTPAMSDALLTAGIDAIEVSLNALSREDYQRRREGADYDVVMDNLAALIAARDRGRHPAKLMVSTIEFPDAGEETARFTAYWTPRVDKVIVRTFFDHQGLVETPGQWQDEKKTRIPCPQFWKRITVAANGWLKFCVNDWFNRTLLADLRTGVTIAEVWNSPAYRQMRDDQLQGRYDRMPMCGPCTDWQAMDWQYDYNRAIADLMHDGQPRTGATLA